jgi:Fe-S cluster assembly protein SufD
LADRRAVTAAPTTEPDWLRELRAQARTRFDELPTPVQKDKGWEFTDVSGLDLDAYAVADGADRTWKPVRSPVVAPDGHPGVWSVEGAAERCAATLPDGVIVAPLRDAVRDHGELVQRHLGSLVMDRDRFAAQNTALWEAGAFVYVPRGVRVEDPIVLSSLQGREGVIHWRALIVVEAGAQAIVAEQYMSTRDDLDAYFNPVTELIVGDGANVEYLCVQDLSERTWILGSQRAQVAANANLHWVGLGLGSGQGKLRMETDINGAGATARVTGAYAGHGTQHLDYETTQEHAAPHTTSDLAFRGVLRDRATSVWSGMIKVDPGAQRTDAFQESRNLLLTDGAHADAIPGLEIEANDVRCTHAATVARLDEDQVFYLQSRGLTRAEAERLLVGGFLEVIAGRLEDSGFLHDPIQAALERELENVLA